MTVGTGAPGALGQQAAPLPGGASDVAPAWSQVRPTNTKAILAVSLLAFAPASIVFGVLARREIRRTGEGGWGLATWGMGLGIGIVSLYVLYFAAIIALYVVFIVGAVIASASQAGVAAGF